MLMRGTIVVALAALSGCKSLRGSPCAPVPLDMIEAFGEVYSECEVEERARVSMHPRLDYPAPAALYGACLVAVVGLVVDTTGQPIRESAYVSRANNDGYAQYVLDAIMQVRFSPAKRKGRVVRQIARYQSEMIVGESRGRTSGSMPRC
jgi:hypothetical protein